jgi:hypothetical protein
MTCKNIVLLTAKNTVNPKNVYVVLYATANVTYTTHNRKGWFCVCNNRISLKMVYLIHQNR